MRHLALLLMGSILLSACGGGGGGGNAESASTASKPDSAEAAPISASATSGIVIRVRSGGKNPDQFCMPEWSIANQTDTNVGALLVKLEWQTRDGQVLEAASEYGAMVEPFTAGRVKDLSLNGYTAACSDLVLKVGTYACRNADAVRIPCPAVLSADTAGGPTVDLSAATEGSMKGAVEAAP